MKRNYTYGLLALIFAFASFFIAASRLSCLFYIPSIFRVIYIPVVYWLFCFVYLLFLYKYLFTNAPPLSEYLKKTVIPLFLFNLYILLGILIISLTKNIGGLSSIYFLYIKAVFFICSVFAVYYYLRVKMDVKEGPRKGINLFVSLSFVFSLAIFILYHFLAHNWLFSIILTLSFVCAIALDRIKVDKLGGKARAFLADDRKVMITLFIIAFAIRLAFSFSIVYKTTHAGQGIDGFLYASDDGLTYDGTAREFMGNGSIFKSGKINIWSQFDYFYAIILAGIYKLFGRNFYIVTAIQSFFNAFIPVLIFLTGKRIFSRNVGLLAASILTIKGGLLLIAAYLGHEAMWLPILAVLVWLFSIYYSSFPKHQFMLSFATGMALGFLLLFRALYIYFLPYLAVWELLFLRKKKFIHKIIRLSVIIAVATCLILAVFALLGNKIVILDKRKANMLWSSSNTPKPFDNIGNERLADFGIKPFTDPKGSLGVIASKPFESLSLAIKIFPLRIVGYLQACQFGFFDPVYMVNPGKIANIFASTLEFYFSLFFIVGLAICFIKRKALASPVFMIITYHVICMSIIICQFAHRYKEVSSSFIYLIGAFGFIEILRYLKKGEVP